MYDSRNLLSGISTIGGGVNLSLVPLTILVDCLLFYGILTKSSPMVPPCTTVSA